MKNRPNVLIVGTGAMANFFAARLAACGVKIDMLGTWPEGLSALNQNGVCMVDAQGKGSNYTVHASAAPADFEGAKLALVLVKAWQTDRAARQLLDCLAPDGIALSLQNGLGNRETLSQHLGEARVGLGVTTMGATLLGPGRVRPGGEGVISLEVNPRLKPFVDIFKKAKFAVESAPDLEALIWGKLVINAAINPLTALLRVPNGEILSRPAASVLMARAADEVARVAAALGVTLPFDAPVSAATDVARKTAANHSSMLQDITRGSPTEIDAICGQVVRFGQRCKVSTPTNYAFLKLICAISVC